MKKISLSWFGTVSLIALLSFVFSVPHGFANEGKGGPNNSNNEGFSFPAEWEEHSAIWLAWYEYPTIPGMHEVTAEIIEKLQQVAEVEVKLVVRPHEKNDAISFMQNYHIDVNAIDFYEYNNLYIFLRDLGPMFVTNGEGQAKVLDFAWNFYGVGNNIYAPTSLGFLDRFLARKLNLPTIKSNIVAEGGGYEVNGAGVMMGFKDMALNRNPGKTIEEIEAEILRMYGYEKMIWIERSPLVDKLNPNGPIMENFFGYGANGHIDEFARFVDPHTILVAEISEEARDSNSLEAIDYEIVEEMVATLEAATDINGQTFTIIRVPAPDLSDHWYERLLTKQDENYDYYKQFGFGEGDTVIEIPAVSYLNFLITNNAVLVAKYWEPGMPQRVLDMDEEARQILQTAFPDREIVQINPIAINWMGGGIHCISQQQPVFNSQ